MPYDENESVIARFYDDDYAVVRTPTGDVDFYVEEAQRAGGPVIEFGCGSGRILLPTARAGVAVTGVDSSEAMLAQLRAKQPDADVHLGDMLDFDAGRMFALATIPFRALAHVAEADDHVAVFANMKRHLRPDGRLIFDVFQPNPKFLAAEPEERLQMEYEKDGRKVRRYHIGESDLSKQVTAIDFRWEVEEADGSVARYATSFTMRWFHRYELEHALARAGFAVEAIHGRFDRSPLASDSPEMIFVAKPR